MRERELVQRTASVVRGVLYLGGYPGHWPRPMEPLCRFSILVIMQTWAYRRPVLILMNLV